MATRRQIQRDIAAIVYIGAVDRGGLGAHGVQNLIGHSARNRGHGGDKMCGRKRQAGRAHALGHGALQSGPNRLAQLRQFINQTLQQPGKAALRRAVGGRARAIDTDHQINRAVLQMQTPLWQQGRSRAHARPFRA